ncbi:hypothetical protein FCY95_15480 [Escherichia coli]|nr:hypothetical protein [Escherichia coli]MDN2138936.1 hypothetical protein [Escherichia coli]MDN2143514.1 hypothetical protein [Escherichia coli]MDN2148721.1 hypothetical protein [Escherichia coli]MDN2153408.1 hypothetical protein [Escherichia coli]
MFLKAVVVYQPVTCGQATGITGGIRLSDWYYKYIREIKHMRCKRKLTAVCSHQTRIGNLDAHLI